MTTMAGLHHVTSADGTRIGFERVGDGPALLLVHGGTADRTRWANVRDALAQRFTLHLVDRRGRGASSEEAAGPYRLELEGRDLAAVLDAIGEPAGVLAHSYGALCAIEAALRSDRVERLMLYEPPIDTPGHPVVPPALHDRMTAQLEAGDTEAALETFFLEVIRVDPQLVELMRDTPLWQARLATMPTLPREAEVVRAYAIDADRLARLTMPVRILLGTDTAPALAASTRALHAALPAAELVELPGQGHAAMDTGTDLFLDAVTAFFAA